MMATVLEELVSKIKFVVDGRGLKQTRDELGRFQAKAKDTSNVLGALRRSMLEAWGARTVLNGIKDVGRFVIQTNVEFQRLRASLTTVTGSAQAAGVAFDTIKKFAKETPFSVQEVTTAFVRLKSLGLDAGVDSLRAYGNVASAMGKNVLDFIEAVADASTGEFERLKEFGIKASTQGDQVAFTFQGQTTTVKKNADAIAGYLKSIGQTTFAGAMDQQMKTLGGAFSNLGDAVEQFVVELGEGGLATAVQEIVADLSEMAGGGQSLAKTLGERLGKAIREIWRRLKELAPTAGELIKRLPDLVDLFGGIAKILLSLVELFAKFSDKVGGVENAFLALLPALAAFRAASIAALGPWGMLVAAMIAAIPIAIEAGNAIGMAMRQDFDHAPGGAPGVKVTKERGLQTRGMLQRFKGSGDAGEDIIRSKLAEVSDEELDRLYGDQSIGAGTQLVIDERERRSEEAKLKRNAEIDLEFANKDAIALTTAANRRGAKMQFDALLKKKRRGKLTPSEAKQLTKLSKELDVGTAKGPKGKKAKEPKDSGGLAEVKDRVDELVRAEELRAFHSTPNVGLEQREALAKEAGAKRRAELMDSVNRGDMSVLGGQFSRERQMMRDAGLIDEAARAAPPVLTVNIQRYDVQVDSPITVEVANANASAADIAASVRRTVREVFRGEVKTAIETVRPVQKV